MNIEYILDKYFIKKPRFRRFITSILERNKNIEIELLGAKLYINTRREHGYLRASRLTRKNGTLRDEIPVIMNIFALLRDGDTFIDIGANVGLFTHSVARLTNIYKRLQIIAIEAHPDTFSRLSQLKHSKIRCLNFAISNSYGESKFVDGAVSHVFTSIEKQNHYSISDEILTVNTRCLDDLEIDSTSIFLKIDVEGQELNVLQGSSNMLSNGNIRAIYIDGYDDDSVNELLIKYGFDLYDGRTLKPITGKVFSLLALRGKHL